MDWGISHEGRRFFRRVEPLEKATPDALAPVGDLIPVRVPLTEDEKRTRETDDGKTWATVVPGSASFQGSLGGFSLDSLGVNLLDFAPGGRYARPAGSTDVPPHMDSADLAVAHDDPNHRFVGNPTQGISLYNTRPPSEWPTGKVFQNWQWPVRVPAQMPILEIVTNRVARSIVSEKYYLTDGVCGPAIDILSEFPLNRGFEVSVVYNSEEFPAWFPLDEVDTDTLVDAEGNSRVSVVVSEYIKARCEELIDDLNLVYEMIQLQKEAYVHGDAFINRVDDVPNAAFQWDHSREYRENTIVELQGLNPTAIWIIRNDVGETERVVGVKQAGADAFDLDLDRLIHLKHKGSSYSTYGFPQTLRALKELQVKEAYLNAAQAWGDRYSLPIRMLKYGVLVRAGEHSGPIATSAMRAAAENALQSYDPAAGHTIVAPFHWEYQYIGADGASAMMVSNELLEANRRILAALGVPSAFLFGDWTNYATARIQYNGLMHKLKTIQENLKRLLERRIFLPFVVMRGYVDPQGLPIRVTVHWKRAHLEDDQGMQDFMAKLAEISGVLSIQTIRETMGFDHQTEEERLDQEADTIARRQIKLRANEQIPSQNPAAMPPEGGPGYEQPYPQTQPVPTAQPSYEDNLRQQVLLRRIQQGLERVQDRLQGEMSGGQQGLAAALAAYNEGTLDQKQLVAAHRVTYQKIKGWKLVERAYQDRFNDLRAVAAWQGTETGVPKPTQHSGLLLAFWLPEPLAERLAVLGYEKPDQLHITLAHFAGLPPGVSEATLMDALDTFCATAVSVEGQITGCGRFTGVHDGEDAIVALFESPRLAQWRQALVGLLTSMGIEVSRPNEYIPHITLAYVPSGTVSPVVNLPTGSLRFDALTLAIGGERRIEFALGGRP